MNMAIIRPAAAAVPMTPATFGPMACMRRKFLGFSFAPMSWQTLEAIGTADRPAAPMIGFSDWTHRGQAHGKMFAHFGEAYGHWTWYRVPGLEWTAGKHRISIDAKAGARFDALVMLPESPAVDRAAMNLFQNWNYAPWDSP